MKVAGKNVAVFIKEGLDWLLYACGTNCTLNVQTDAIETSVSGTGKFATFIPTKNSFTGTLDGIMSFDGAISLNGLRKKQLAQEIFMFKFQRVAGSNTYTSEGKCFIVNSSDSGDYSDMNVFSIEIQGTGPLIDGFENEPPLEPFDIKYGFTDLDTTGTGLNRYSYVNSIDAAILANQYQTKTIADINDDIEVTFTNTEDKVLFIQVPDIVDYKFFWSVEGDPLQQNQPIAIILELPGVWFSFSDMLYKTYVVKYQTTFGGKITLSE